jgi:membrane protein
VEASVAILSWKPVTLAWTELGARLWRRFRAHRLLDHAASLSFYFMLSLFPLLLLGMSIAGSVLRSGADSRAALRSALTEVMPRSGLQVVDTTLDELQLGSGGFAVWVAAILACWSAVRGTRALIFRLNVAYDSVGKRSSVRRALLSIALSAGMLLLLATASVLLVHGKRLGGQLERDFATHGVLEGAWWFVSRVLLVGCAVLAFGLFYAYAPSVVDRRRRWISPGAVVGVLVWLLASAGLRLWLQNFSSYTLVYGSVGAVIALQLWLYITALSLLLGAELNAVVEEHSRTMNVHAGHIAASGRR